MQTGEQREGEDSTGEKERGEGRGGKGRGGEGKKGEKEIERVKRRKRMILTVHLLCVALYATRSGWLIPQKKERGELCTHKF